MHFSLIASFVETGGVFPMWSAVMHVHIFPMKPSTETENGGTSNIFEQASRVVLDLPSRISNTPAPVLSDRLMGTSNLSSSAGSLTPPL